VGTAEASVVRATAEAEMVEVATAEAVMVQVLLATAVVAMEGTTVAAVTVATKAMVLKVEAAVAAVMAE
jgi:hypothetical protein